MLWPLGEGDIPLAEWLVRMPRNPGVLGYIPPPEPLTLRAVPQLQKRTKRKEFLWTYISLKKLLFDVKYMHHGYQS